MPYRDDLANARAAVQRLEDERDTLAREVALVESLPTSRTLEARVLGAASTIERSSVVNEPFDSSSGAALAAALSKVYGVSGRIEAQPRGLVFRADLPPRGRSVEITIAGEGSGRTRIGIVDRLSSSRQMVWGLVSVATPVVNMVSREQWVFAAGALVAVAVLSVVLRRVTNLPTARRREREAMTAESALDAALRLHALTLVRTRAAEPGSEDAAIEPAIEDELRAQRAAR